MIINMTKEGGQEGGGEEGRMGIGVFKTHNMILFDHI